jgi:hypothetical protein
MDLKGISKDVYCCFLYARIPIYFEGKTSDSSDVCAAIYVESRIVKNLGLGLLLGMDVLELEEVVIDVGCRNMMLPHC